MSIVEGKIDSMTKPSPGLTLTTKKGYCYEKQDYVNGGNTFNYPAGLFSLPPNVALSIELKNLAYSTGQIIIPIITSNTTTSSTVRVNVGTTASVSEVLRSAPPLIILKLA